MPHKGGGLNDMRTRDYPTMLLPILLVACVAASVRVAEKPEPGARKPLSLAYTMCAETADGAAVPATYFRQDVILDPDRMRVLVAHEGTHARQVARYPSCEAFEAYRATQALLLEAEAFCWSARAMTNTGGPASPADLGYVARWLSSGYPEFEVTPEEALAVISIYCSEAR